MDNECPVAKVHSFGVVILSRLTRSRRVADGRNGSAPLIPAPEGPPRIAQGGAERNPGLAAPQIHRSPVGAARKLSPAAHLLPISFNPVIPSRVARRATQAKDLRLLLSTRRDDTVAIADRGWFWRPNED